MINYRKLIKVSRELLASSPRCAG